MSCSQIIKHALFIGLVLVWIGNAGVIAQSNPKLERITVVEGLSQGYISDILQDQDGFIWFGTRNGLNRYDGREFKVFTHNLFDPYSISNNVTQTVWELDDFIFVRASGAANFFNKKTSRFYRLQAPKGFQLDGAVSSVVSDKKSRLFICLQEQSGKAAIFRVTPVTPIQALSVESPPFIEVKEIEKTPSIPQKVTLFPETPFGIWGLADGVLFKFDPESMTFEYRNECNGLLEGSYCFDYESNTLFFGGRAGFVCINKNGVHQVKTGISIRNIEVLKDKFLIANGTKVFHTALTNITKDYLAESDFQELMHVDQGLVSSLYSDSSDNLWIGTNGYGVIKYNPRLQLFRLVFPGMSVQNSILLNASGDVGVTIAQEKSFAYSGKAGYQNEWDQFGRGTRTITDKEGVTWLITNSDPSDDLEIYRQNSVERKWEFKQRFHVKDYKLGFAIETDKSDYLWTVCANGLMRYNRVEDRMDSFFTQSLFSDTRKINALQQTAGGDWWIGTDRGLARAKPAASGYDFSWYPVLPVDRENAQKIEISTLLAEPEQEHVLWIGSVGNGLIKLDTRTGNLSYHNTQNGFPDDVIYGVLNDNSGQIWISTNKGLVRLDPKTGYMRQYTVDDGLPTIEFNGKAFAKKTNGTMLFGCLEGLVVFDPDHIKNNPVAPQVRLTGLEINNQSIVFGDSSAILSQAIEYSNQLDLSYTQNNITLHFAALEFTNPTQNKFAYYLKGAEPEWIHTTTENKATYLNLSPGLYTFWLKACNSDGIWCKKPIALQIRIQPPWYQTIWAYLLYFVIISGISYWSIRFYLHRQRLQDRLALEKREAERLKELDAFKSQVFTNITHEFRTPLTVIQGMADRMVESATEQPKSWVKQTGQMIKRNGAYMLRMINQLLDLAKLEAKALVLQNEPTQIVALVRYLSGSLESLAANKGVVLQTTVKMEEVNAVLDKQQFQTILHNLLSNAIKFTPAKGKIITEVDRVINWQAGLDSSWFYAVKPANINVFDWISIRVQDSGTGISAERLSHIFDLFYQSATNEGGGSGIGLALVKELVQLMEGALMVRSEAGNGAEFMVVLPLIEAGPANWITTLQDSEPGPEALAPAGLKASRIADDPKKKDLPNLLIIEDNPDVQHYLHSCVEDSYQVAMASDGQEGIDMALETVPDIIISDVMLPLKDGFEVAKTLKNDERTSHVPIILLTARADMDSRLQGLERGADAYLTKPFDRMELLVWLRKLLELRQKLQERYAGGFNVQRETGQPQHFEDAFMQKVQTVLEAEMDNENFGVEELCRAMHLGRTQLHNKLKALTGKSTTLYIRSVRLHKAFQLLLNTDKTISEIAFEVGFRHLQHFSTSFAEEFGKSPSSYRK
ncbi:MAG: response regulator [Saprospiraceae bacterium]